MADASRPGAVAGRDVADLLRGVVTDVGEALDALVGRSLDVQRRRGHPGVPRVLVPRSGPPRRPADCVGAVIGLDQSHDLRRLVLAAEVVERHVDDELSPADAGALAQAGFTSRIDVPLLAGAEVLGVLSLAETRAGPPPHAGRALPARDARPPGGRHAARGAPGRGGGRAGAAAHRSARRRPRHRRGALAGGDRRRGAGGGGRPRRRRGVRRGRGAPSGRRHVRARG